MSLGGWSVLEALVAECQDKLTPQGREALWLRGLSDSQIDLLRIGFSEQPLPLEGLSFVSNCFVYPLTNTLGQIRGVQVRSSSRATKVYKDYFALGAEAEPVLFGLGEAMKTCWEAGYLWLVEGVHDLPPIQRHRPSVVATLRAGATPAVIKLLRRLGVVVYCGWDNDATGEKFRSNLIKYNPDIDCRGVRYPVLDMPGGGKTKDPGDLWEVWGSSKIATYLDFVHPLA